MNKKEFLKKLSSNLKGITKEEKKDIIRDFEEHFELGIEEGRTEEDLAELLGNPKDLARQLRASVMIERAEKERSAGNIFGAVFASLGLGLFNLIFILGPFLVAVALLIALYAIAVAITATGVVGFLASIIGQIFPEYFTIMVNPVAVIFASIAVTCFGILFFVGCIYLSKCFYRGFLKYIKFNVRVITGRGKKDEEI